MSNQPEAIILAIEMPHIKQKRNSVYRVSPIVFFKDGGARFCTDKDTLILQIRRLVEFKTQLQPSPPQLSPSPPAEVLQCHNPTHARQPLQRLFQHLRWLLR